jgi:flagellar biosynthesis protein FliQ
VTPEISILFHEALRALVILVGPTLLIPLVGFTGALLLSMFGIQERSMQYAARMIALVMLLLMLSSKFLEVLMGLFRVSLGAP